jgi:hypothetical protein
MRFNPVLCVVALIGSLASGSAGIAQQSQDDDLELALKLAALLQSARSVIASEQDRINDPDIGDKGLSGDVVLARAIEGYAAKTGTNLADLPAGSQDAVLIGAMSLSVRQVMDENANSINRQGIGFKGFVPAVFARLVNENFGQAVGDLAQIKVTAPPGLVRNRKARPDAWESKVIAEHLLSPDWTKGEVFSEVADASGRAAFRALVPEYYGESCLACHGSPAGEVDITGYPKEGGKLGDLGGVISITLYN